MARARVEILTIVAAAEPSVAEVGIRPSHEQEIREVLQVGWHRRGIKTRMDDLRCAGHPCRNASRRDWASRRERARRAGDT